MNTTKNDSELMNLLEEKKKKPADLAEALSVTERAVHYWMAGTREPRLTIKQFKALLKFFNCVPDELPNEFGPNKNGLHGASHEAIEEKPELN